MEGGVPHVGELTGAPEIDEIQTASIETRTSHSHDKDGED